MMSSAVPARIDRTWKAVRPGSYDLSRAAIAAAWGVAADVPVNGVKFGTSVVTASAAAKSGF